MFNLFSLLKELVGGALIGISLLFAPLQLPPKNTVVTPPLNQPLSPSAIANQTREEAATSTVTTTKGMTLGKNTLATTTPKKEKVALDLSPKGVAETIVQHIPVIDTPTIPPSEINTKTRAAVVNILCINTHGDSLKSITGSGVIIDPKGIILTNAHIAQFMLLENYPTPGSISCTIRTGSPATPTYKAALIYISPRWVEENRTNITSENPLGTGEYDYALLDITRSIDGTSLPAAFPYVAPQIEDIDLNRADDQYVVAGYPAGFLGAYTIQWNLFQTSSIATVKEVFTFATSTVDLLALSSTVVAQKGASGGAVVALRNEKLVGIIVTTTEGATTGERILRAESMSHINRSFKVETGQSITDYVSVDPEISGELFRSSKAPYLATLLITELTKNKTR